MTPPPSKVMAAPDAAVQEDVDLDALTAELVAGYRADQRGHRIGRRFLPSRRKTEEIIGHFINLFFPGYFADEVPSWDAVSFAAGSILARLRVDLAFQIEQCLCHAAECGGGDIPTCSRQAQRLANEVLRKIPELRRRLVEDAQAAFDGDPAAHSLHEVVLCYPGFLAVAVFRIAHELWLLGVPLLPRMMTEWAHQRTGADIHPGATIGRAFFIDHATGVVVGETSEIGDNVKLYQGVTLGALSHPRDESGRVIRNTKRHPTVESEVTVYANATVLGGQTRLGRGSVVGGSVFLTKSVPDGARVALKPPDLQVKVPNSAPPPGEPQPANDDGTG